MEKSSLAILITGFVLIIIGTSLIGTVASEGLLRTSRTQVTDESISIAAAADGTNINPLVTFTVANANNATSAIRWKQTACPLEAFVATNGSGDAWTVTTDYVVDLSTGTFTLVNTTTVNQSILTDNTTLVDYTYCNNEYLTEGWSRTVINLVPGFFAIAILLIGVGLVFMVFKKENIISI